MFTSQSYFIHGAIVPLPPSQQCLVVYSCSLCKCSSCAKEGILPDLKYVSWFVRSAWGEKKLQAGRFSCQLPFLESPGKKTMGRSYSIKKWEPEKKIDKLRICLVHAQHLKKAFNRQSTVAFPLHSCSASNLCDCVQFVFVWMCVHFVCLHVVALHPFFAVLFCRKL